MQLAWGRARQTGAARRVAVTGLGVVVSCGIGKDAFWEGLCAPAPVGDRRVTGFDPTNWFGPNPPAVVAMLRAAGFGRVAVVHRPRALPLRFARAVWQAAAGRARPISAMNQGRLVVHAWR